MISRCIWGAPLIWGQSQLAKTVHGFWIPVNLSVWILIVSGIPDSLSCIPDFKDQDSEFHKQKFRRFRNPDSLIWGRRCLVPRRLSLDENFPWSLAVHHQSLAFRARLYHACEKRGAWGGGWGRWVNALRFKVTKLVSRLARSLKTDFVQRNANSLVKLLFL